MQGTTESPGGRVRTPTSRALLVVAAAAFVAGCGQSADKSAPAAAPAAPTASGPADAAKASPPLPSPAAGANAKDAGAASGMAEPIDPAALRGKVTFESKCLLCHTIGGGEKIGPDLHGVTKLLGGAWIERWLRDPAPMLASDPHAKAQLAKYSMPMPKPDLTGDEIRDVLAYLTWADATLPGSAPAPGHEHANHQHGMK